MAYQLGIDLGTTYTAAAVAVEGRVEPLALGTRSSVLPTVVFAKSTADGDTGELLVGEAAETRGVMEPTRVGREFKRRLGDPAPLVLGGVPYPAEALMGAVLAHVHAVAVVRMGGEPEHVVITHPATYSSYRLDLLRDAARRAGLGSAELLTEPQAAATHYAALGRLDVGDVIAVYDLGGGTFDAAIVRNTGAGFELLGEPHGLERLGGIDFDVAVLEHVNDTMGGQLATLDNDDPAVRAGLARLRSDARHAKEVLSSDTDTTIPLVVPGVVGEVHLSRGELERLVMPRIRESIDVLRRAIASAGLSPDDLAAVLLVGGSSRIPAVRQLVTDALRVRVTADIDPEMAVALGAALHAAAQHPAAAVVAAVVPPPAPPAPLVPPATPRAPAPAPGRRRMIAIGAGVAVVLALLIGFLATRGGGSDTASGTTPDATTVATVATDSTDSTEATDTVTTEPATELEGCDLFAALVADSQTPVEDLRAEGAEGCDLTGLDMSARDLSGIDFGGATLDGVNFDDSTVSGALFLDASLTGTSFERSIMEATDFTGANLTGTSIVESTAPYAVFEGVTMRGAVFVDTDCTGCNFIGTVLTGSDLAGTNLSGATINFADFESVGIDRVSIDLSTVVGPAPGTVAVLDAGAAEGAADQVATTLDTVGYQTFQDSTPERTATVVSCRGDFFGSEMRKLMIVVDNFFFANEEEVDFNDISDDLAASLVDDESISCVVLVGSDLVVP